MQSTVFILDEEQNIKKSYCYDAFGGIIEEPYYLYGADA